MMMKIEMATELHWNTCANISLGFEKSAALFEEEKLMWKCYEARANCCISANSSRTRITQFFSHGNCLRILIEPVPLPGTEPTLWYF